MCQKNNGVFELKDLKPCLNWDSKHSLCNVKYTAIISPKPIKFDENNFYSDCKGCALPALCCAFQGAYNDIRFKIIEKIPNVRIFEV